MIEKKQCGCCIIWGYVYLWLPENFKNSGLHNSCFSHEIGSLGFQFTLIMESQPCYKEQGSSFLFALPSLVGMLHNQLSVCIAGREDEMEELV